MSKYNIVSDFLLDHVKRLTAFFCFHVKSVSAFLVWDDILHHNEAVFCPLHRPGCDESCSECRGPTRLECLSCSDPAASLKDGVCVSDCGAGYYNQEETCYGKTDTSSHCIIQSYSMSTAEVPWCSQPA